MPMVIWDAAAVSDTFSESPSCLSPEHPPSATVSVSNILAKRTFPNPCLLFAMSFTPFHFYSFVILPQKVQLMSDGIIPSFWFCPELSRNNL
jgi:hypothetical protein